MSRPPKFANLLLQWLSGNAELEDMLGDLEEVFQQRVARQGKTLASIHYWIQVVSLLFSYGLQKRKSQAAYSSFYQPNTLVMIKSYFKIAYRNLKKQKAFTLINVAGLAMGMSIALLALAMFVELNQFDEFHPDAKNTYRITTRLNEAGNLNQYASAPPALTYAVDEQIAGLNTSVHINDYLFPEIEHEGNQISAQGYFTEPSFFQVFFFPLEWGSPAALNEPGLAIITRELATKLYGDEPAMDKIIQTKDWGPLRVAGVLKEFPRGTHLMFDLLVGFPTSKKFDANLRSSEWINFRSNYFYFNVSPDQKATVEKQIEKLGKRGDPLFQAQEIQATYKMQPLVDITPGDMMSDTLGIEFDRPTMLLFFGIALLILVPACFNYTNMSIAIALKRSKEVGIRKVMGSHRQQIIGQFLVETIIISLMAVVLSSYIFHVIRFEFLSMLVGGSAISLSLTWWHVFAFVLFAVATGILTGIGPALFFAKISPIQALRSGSGDQKVSISGIRKGLLVFQFALTLVLMIGIGVLLKQYMESRTYEFPFNVENTFVIPTKNQDIQLIRNSYLNQPGVAEISFSSSIPGTPLAGNVFAHFADLQDSLRTQVIYVDDHYVDHMNLEFVWGSKFPDQTYQVEQVVVNEELMRKQKLIMPEGDSLSLYLTGGQRLQIIGVIKDYNHEPLNQRIEPMLIRRTDGRSTFAILTLASKASGTNYSQLEATWDSLFPNTPFEASLLKNEIDKAYAFFKIGLKIFGFLAAMAISISCLGLMGMVIFATENRIKEVAIRKILGANKRNLFGTLAGLFIKLWCIALIFAVPISYFFYDGLVVQLYNKFSEGVGITEIALSVLVTLTLGGLAIFWQVNKIAGINPATNLRSE